MLVIHTIKLHFMIINASNVFIASVNGKYLLFRRIPRSLKGGRTAKKCLFKIYLKTTPLHIKLILVRQLFKFNLKVLEEFFV